MKLFKSELEIFSKPNQWAKVGEIFKQIGTNDRETIFNLKMNKKHKKKCTNFNKKKEKLNEKHNN